MAHTHRVSAAIQGALSSSEILRDLFPATTLEQVNDVLGRLDPPITLQAGDFDEFIKSLHDGVMTMDAKTLLDYYDSLAGKADKRVGKGKPQEWTP